jgi:hypothetical protein
MCTTINSQNSTIIQKIQNKCLRICINPLLLTSTTNLHSIVNTQTVQTRAKILTDSNLRKAEIENTLTKSIISDYKIKSDLNEGSQLIGLFSFSYLIVPQKEINKKRFTYHHYYYYNKKIKSIQNQNKLNKFSFF